MKLKDGFILHNVGNEHMVVATGDAVKDFNGLVRNNETANFIYQQLMEDTTEDAIVEAMLKEYDAPRDVIAADVHKIIEKVRLAGFLDG